MSVARFYVDGENWEIMGNVVDKFLPYTNSLEASRSGRIFSNTETKVRTVSVDDIKLDTSEFEAIESFLVNCSSKRFNVTLSIDEDCPETAAEFNYLNCIIEGEPEYSPFEKKISNFSFGYEDRVPVTRN